MIWSGRVPVACPPCVRHLSATCPPRVRLAMSTLSPLWPQLQTLSAMCPLKPWPCLWTLSALGLLWGRAGAWHHQAKFFYTIAQSTAFIMHARWSVSFIVILAHQFRPSQAHPMLEKLFGVYAAIICIYIFLQTVNCFGVLRKKKWVAFAFPNLPCPNPVHRLVSDVGRGCVLSGRPCPFFNLVGRHVIPAFVRSCPLFVRVVDRPWLRLFPDLSALFPPLSALCRLFFFVCIASFFQR